MFRTIWRSIITLLLVGMCFCSARQADAEGRWQRLANVDFGITIAQVSAVSLDGRVYVMTNGLDALYAGFQEYSLRTHRWTGLRPPMTAPSTLVAAEGRLYAMGDDWNNGTAPGSSTGIYNPIRNAWTLDERRPGDPSTTRLSFCTHVGGSAVFGHDGRIYQMAGGTGDLLGSCMEAYDLHRHTWTQLAHLILDEYLTAATTDLDGRIYVLGGVALGGEVTNAVQVYDPQTDRWTTVTPMPTARAALAAVTGPDGRIYAIGGTPDPIGYQKDDRPPRELGVVEAYDPRTNTWSKVASLHVPRYFLGAALGADGKIYVIGGHNSNAVETYQVPHIP